MKHEVRVRDGRACVSCGMTAVRHFLLTGHNLEVHRTTPGSQYTLEGCVTLCRRCHAEEPRRRKGDPDLAYGPVHKIPFDAHTDAAMTAYLRFVNEFRKRKMTRKALVIRAVREFLARKGEGFWPGVLQE